jgi:hypothetical protein
MNRMIAITISAGATTSATDGIAWPPNLAFTIPPPTATRTRKKVPSSSEKTRRHSYLESQKSKRLTNAFGTSISSRRSTGAPRGICCPADAPVAGGPAWLLLNGSPP